MARVIHLVPDDGRSWDEMTDEEVLALYEGAGMLDYGRIVLSWHRGEREPLCPVD